MFGQYFNIDESVFSIAPNPKYLYLSKQHEEALAHLIYGITRKSGFVCLTGDIGTGKTTICRCMFEQLPEDTDIAFVINPKFSPLELLASICDELNIENALFQPNIKGYVKKLNDYLIDAHGNGRNTVLVIDEAQNLSIEALEHVRALTNLETNEQKLLQIILIGQPELKTLLAEPELEQVNQRITARFHIGPLKLNDTNRYINHRLQVAGAKQKIFSIANIKQIHRLSKGVPRRINILCDRILLAAYTIRKNKISSQIINQSAKEVFGIVPLDTGVFPKALAASVFALLVSGVAVFAYQNNKLDMQSTASDRVLAPITADEEIELLAEEAEMKVNANEAAAKEAIKLPNIGAAAASRETKTIINEKKASFVVKNEAPKEAAIARVEENIGVKTPKIKQGSKNTLVTVNKAASNNDVGISTSSKKQLEFTSYGKAYQSLFRLWAVDYSSTEVAPCEHAYNNQLHCYQSRGSMQRVIGLNRPVLLKSKAEQFEVSYIVVVSIEDDYAVIIQRGEYKLVAISEIEAEWNGEFEMLWRPLQLGVSLIGPGQKGRVVALLDEKLAKLQGRQSVVPHPFIYSGELIDQVKAFQVANKLPPDGVVGPITQMYFNNYSRSNTTDTPYLIK